MLHGYNIYIWKYPVYYKGVLRNLKAFVTTDNELKVMATAAIIGDNNSPNTGYSMPAATGTPSEL